MHAFECSQHHLLSPRPPPLPPRIGRQNLCAAGRLDGDGRKGTLKDYQISKPSVLRWAPSPDLNPQQNLFTRKTCVPEQLASSLDDTFELKADTTFDKCDTSILNILVAEQLLHNFQSLTKNSNKPFELWSINLPRQSHTHHHKRHDEYKLLNRTNVTGSKT